MPTRDPVISGAWQRCYGDFVSGRRRASLRETTGTLKKVTKGDDSEQKPVAVLDVISEG